jgi:hypothetical protein
MSIYGCAFSVLEAFYCFCSEMKGALKDDWGRS